MGSPVTISGFNKIDFGAVLDAVMQQERAPLATLTAQQKTLESRSKTYGTLATKLAAFQSAVEDLADADGITGRTVSNTDTTALTASAGDGAVAGLYDVVVQELARAQVTAATSFPPDADETIVAWGGALNIGGVSVTIDAPVTLQGLADRINSYSDVPVTATVIRAGVNSWQLVLTGKATGTTGAFTIQNTLTGGAGVTFADEDLDGISGDSAEDNAVAATNARVLLNNVTVESETNTIEGAIPGVTLTLLKKDPTATATLSVTEDLAGAKSRITKLVDTYNDLVKFAEDQNIAAAKGDNSSISRDALLRGLRTALREGLSGEYDAGGDLASLATVGIAFDRSGRLTFKSSKFDEAAVDNLADIRKLFAGNGADKGAFQTLTEAVKAYTASDGLLQGTRNRLDEQVRGLNRRIADFESRLAIRRATLQREYIAADLAMSRLNNQVSALSSLGGQYRLF